MACSTGLGVERFTTQDFAAQGVGLRVSVEA